MENPRSADFWQQVKGLFARAEVPPPASVVAAEKAAPGAQGAQAGGQRLDSAQDFDAKLSNILLEGGVSSDLVTGKVHMINVDSVRQRLGDRWEKLSDHVHKIIAKTLENRLSKRDFFTRYQDDIYIIVFGELSIEEAKLKSSLLAEEIMKMLFGEAEAKDIEALGLKTVVAQVDGTLKAEKLTTVDAIAGLLNNAQNEESNSTVQYTPTDSTVQPSPLANNLAELFRSVEEQLLSFENMALESAPGQNQDAPAQIGSLLAQLASFQNTLLSHQPSPEQGNNQSPGPSLAMNWQAKNVNALDVIQSLIMRAETQLIAQGRQLPHGVQGSQESGLAMPSAPQMPPISTAQAALADAAGVTANALQQTTLHQQAIPAQNQNGKPAAMMSGSDAQSGQPSQKQPPSVENVQGVISAPQVSFFYRPIWHTPKKMVSIYLCQLSLRMGQDVTDYDDIIRENKDRDLSFSLDTLLIQKTRQDFMTASQGNFTGAIGLPVHYSTLNWLAGRQKYLDFVSGIPVESRKLLIWEIIKTPHQNWQTELKPMVDAISPFGRAIFIRADLRRKKMSAVTNGFRTLAAAKIHAVGLDINDLPGSQSDMLAQLEDFAIAAEEHGLKCYVHGVSTASLNMAAVCAGFQYVSGNVVAQPVDVPQGFQEADASSVYLKNRQKTGG